MGCAGSKGKDGALARTAKAGQKGKKKKGAKGNAQARQNDGIPAFSPPKEVAEAYAAYIAEVRRAGVSAGIMPPVEYPHQREAVSIGDNIRKNPPVVLTASVPGAVEEQKDREEASGQGAARAVHPNEPAAEELPGDAADHIRSGNANSSANRADTPAPPAGPLDVAQPPASVTVYQCRPIDGRPLVAKGMYSQIVLARMSVVRGEVSDMQPPHLKAAGALGTDAGSSPAPQSRNREHGVFVERHYLIAMKEMAISSGQPQPALLAQLKHHVQRWTRLSAYCPRLMRCIQMELVYASKAKAAGSSSNDSERKHCPAPDSTFHDLHGVLRAETPSRKNSELGKKKPTAAATAKAATTTADAVDGPLTDIRVYVEYAKYGSLRAFQLREMPAKFQREYLHELTARAFMREVLLALLDLHDCDELQLDLSAKTVFLVRPIKSVFQTYFPAYIADLPAGRLMQVPPHHIHEALCLLNPIANPRQDTNGQPASAVASTDTRRRVNSPRQTTLYLQNYPNWPSRDRSGQAIAPPPAVTGAASAPIRPMTGGSAPLHNFSMVTNPPAESSPVVLPPENFNESRSSIQILASGGWESAVDGGGSSSPRRPVVTPRVPRTGSGSSIEIVSEGHVTDGEGPLTPTVSISLSTRASNTARTHRGTGQPSSAELYAGAGEQPWTKDTFRTYGRENGFDDCASLPVPSPHDGFPDYSLATAVAKLTLKSELPATSECTQVYALRDTPDGGIAVVSFDHYAPAIAASPHGAAEDDGSARARPSTTRSGSDDDDGDPCEDSVNVVEAGNMSFARGHMDAVIAQPPQCVPARSNVANYVLPSSIWNPCAAAAAASDGASPSTGSPSHAGGSADSHPSRACDEHFRGPIVRLQHTASIRRALAQTTGTTSASAVPVHKFVNVATAAPEVLQRGEFSPASDIYAFAMTFIELVTEAGNIMQECVPSDLARPKTRRERDDYDAVFAANLSKWYSLHVSELAKTDKEQPPVSDCIHPVHPPVVVPLPEQLSDEAKNMLRWCLQADPAKRPTAQELLQTKYFLLGDWVGGDASAGTGSMTMRREPSATAAAADAEAGKGAVKLPERPWGLAENAFLSYEHLAEEAGFPVITNDLFRRAATRPRVEAKD